VQPERPRNRGTHCKGDTLATSVLRRHLDGCEMLPEWLLPLPPTAREYGHSQRSKAGHDARRARNTLRKTTDRAPQPGLADRLPAAPNRRCWHAVFSLNYWSANRVRKRRDRSSVCPQWVVSQPM